MATQAIRELVTTCRCISGCDLKASCASVVSHLSRDARDHWNGNDVDKSASLSSTHAQWQRRVIAVGDLAAR